MRLHQRYDRFVRVARLCVNACQIEQTIGIVGALLEGDFVHLLGASQMPGVLCGEPQVVEDVKVGGVGVQRAGKGLLGIPITLPVHLNHSHREVNAGIVAGPPLDFLKKRLRRGILFVRVKRLGPQE